MCGINDGVNDMQNDTNRAWPQTVFGYVFELQELPPVYGGAPMVAWALRHPDTGRVAWAGISALSEATQAARRRAKKLCPVR